MYLVLYLPETETNIRVLRTDNYVKIIIFTPTPDPSPINGGWVCNHTLLQQRVMTIGQLLPKLDLPHMHIRRHSRVGLEYLEV